MNLSLTLSTYLGRHFLLAVGVALGGVLVIAWLIDLVELFRRTAEEDVPVGVVIEMAVLKLPHLASQLLPYSVLLGAMMALIRLTRSQELVVARAAGVSVWQFLAPAVAAGFAIGAIWVVVLNPVTAAMIARFDVLETRYIEGKPSMFSVSDSGLWLRRVDAGDAVLMDRRVTEYVLRAARLTQTDMTLHDVTIFAYGDERKFIARIDARTARLDGGKWWFDTAVISVPGLVPLRLPSYGLRTDLSLEHIQDSFAEPRTISFWQLSGFIHTLEKAGFSALRHRLYWHSVLATPLLLSAMVMIAAIFSLRLHRKGRIGAMAVGGVITGFFINFMISLFQAFGISGGIPVALAAWAPPLIALMVAVFLLLHLEDG